MSIDKIRKLNEKNETTEGYSLGDSLLLSKWENELKDSGMNETQIQNLSPNFYNMKQETKQTAVGSNSVEDAKFTTQYLDEVNYSDLQKWIAEDVLHGLVDEEKGGIVGYIHHEHIENIADKLNSFQALKDSNRELIEANKWLRGALEEAVNADCVYETNPALLELFNAALKKAKQLQ